MYICISYMCMYIRYMYVYSIYIYIHYLHMHITQYRSLSKQANAVQDGVKKRCGQVTIHLQVVGFAFRASLVTQPR